MDLIVAPVGMVSKSTPVVVVQALATGGADAFAPPGVFVVGGHVVDGRVQPDRVVLDLSSSARRTAGSVIANRSRAAFTAARSSRPASAIAFRAARIRRKCTASRAGCVVESSWASP